MAPKYNNQDTPYKRQVNLNLDKLNNQQVQQVNIDLTQINITNINNST